MDFRKLPWITLLIAAMAFAASWSRPLSMAWEFNREAIAEGQIWRVATCHVTHWNFDHLAWDLGVFLVLGALCECRNRKAYAICLGAATFIIPAGVWLFLWQMDYYRGLSGVDTALFTLLGVQLLTAAIRERRWIHVILLTGLFAALAGKTCIELLTGHTLFVDHAVAGFTPVPLAHILGTLSALAGCGYWLAAQSGRLVCLAK